MDKIEAAIQAGILNTKPDDWETAQAQLESLLAAVSSERAANAVFARELGVAQQAIHEQQVTIRDWYDSDTKCRKAIQDLVDERDRLNQTVAALTKERDQQKKVCADHAGEMDRVRAQRDSLQGICERLKRELEEARGDINAVGWTQTRYYLEQQDELRKELREAREALDAALAIHKAQIVDLETQLMRERDRSRYALNGYNDDVVKMSAEIADLTKERDNLDAELLDLRSAPSGTKKQADRILELEGALKSQCDLTSRTISDGLRIMCERDNLEAKLEQSTATAEMVTALAKERDDAQSREVQALRQLGRAVERVEEAKAEVRAERKRRSNAMKLDDRAFEMMRDQIADLKQRLADVELGPAGRPTSTSRLCKRCGTSVPPSTSHTCLRDGETFEQLVDRSMVDPDVPAMKVGEAAVITFDLDARPRPGPAGASALTCSRCGSNVLDGHDHGVGACSPPASADGPLGTFMQEHIADTMAPANRPGWRDVLSPSSAEEVPSCARCGRCRDKAAIDADDPLCAPCAAHVVKEVSQSAEAGGGPSCQMLTPYGRCEVRPAAGVHHGHHYCERHLAAVLKPE